MSEVDLEVLKEAGLTEYEAKCYVALLRYGSMEGSEVAEKANVPKTRVYDSLRSLDEKNLVSKIQERPMKFSPVEPEKGLKPLYEKEVERLNHLEEKALDSLQSVEGERELESGIEKKVDVVHGEEEFFEQCFQRIQEATDKVYVMGVGRDPPRKLNLEVRKLMERGVEARFLTTKYDEENRERVEKFREETGIDMRIYPEGPKFAFYIIDNREAMVNVLDEEVKDDRLTVFMEVPELAKGLEEYFDSMWKKGIQLEEANTFSD
jgi:sugar-specific transcriptional regulator TrmB